MANQTSALISNPRCSTLLENVIIDQVVQKFPVSLRTQEFITDFTNPSVHPNLSQLNLVNALTPHFFSLQVSLRKIARIPCLRHPSFIRSS
jgi:hypothetical protein